jgi:V/A-type H+-transporting ATPase subunit E
MVAAAEKSAAERLEQANEAANEIVRNAREEADRILKQLQSAMEIAASQFLAGLKRQLEADLLTLPLKGKLSDTFDDTAFLKELISACVQGFMQDSGAADITLLVSEAQRDRLEDFATQLIRRTGAGGGGTCLNLQTNGISCGFIIGKTDGRVMLDFTLEAFLDLFLRYLSPKFHAWFKNIDLKSSRFE